VKINGWHICFLSAWLPGILSGGSIGFLQTNLVSDGAVPAVTTDPDLKNPWGISFSPTSPFWIANNGTGLSTLYNGLGAKQGLVVSMPPAGQTPTGTVFSAISANFLGDRFLFATEAGTIAGWQGSAGTTAVTRVDLSFSGAAFKGLAIAGDHIYATDFAGGKVDVFDGNYSPVTLPGSFQDPNLPAGFAPFGIQNIGGTIVVTFAKQGSGGDEQAGAGLGIVDVFDTNGFLVRRLISGGVLNAPWGLALAPATFGDLAGLILVGNFGDGLINGFDPTTGAFVGSLSDSLGKPLVIDGLWGLAFGNGGTGFSSNKLYFTAGPNGEADGLFGSLEPVPEPSTALLLTVGLSLLFGTRRRR